MTDGLLVHSSQPNGKILCGAVPPAGEAFYAVPLYRGTEKVTCAACLAAVESARPVCPICASPSPAGIETNYVCDKCWRDASVTFSMSTAGPESHAQFGATMDVARLAAASARMPMRKQLRRERVTRAWQSFQGWMLLCAVDYKSCDHGPQWIARRVIWSAHPASARAQMFPRPYLDFLPNTGGSQ